MLLRATAIVVVLVAGAALADEGFVPGFHCSGVDGTVHCGLVHEGQLYVGGEFAAAGDVAALNIARWDGAQWHALGPGLDRAVFDLVVFEGEVVACGEFIHAGELTVNQVAGWDGAAWHAFASGVGDDPYVPQRTLAVFEGQLWCSGFRWWGTSWTQSLNTNGWIHDLEVVGDMLVAGGDFSEVNGQPHENTVGRVGSSLVTMPGMDYRVVDLEAHAGQMHAVQYWRSHEDPPPARVWNGTVWEDLGDVDLLNDVEYKQLLSRGGVLRVLGIDKIPGGWAAKIAAWNGVSWNWNLGADAYDGVLAETVVDHPDGLVIGGRMGACGGTPVCGLAMITEDDVVALGPPGLGVNGREPQPVWGLTASDDEGVVVFGSFEGVGPVLSGLTALFDGSQWLARNLGDTDCDMAAFYQGQLHAWPRTGEDYYPQHAIWNGSGWDIHDAGTEVWALTGTITHEGRLLSAGTDVYDWTVPGEPVQFADLGDDIAWCIAEYGDGFAVGGPFTEVNGQPAAHIAVHDGESWSCPGGGMDNQVWSLIEFEGRLIAGGWFTTAGGVPANRVAAWNGTTWEPMGEGFDARVNHFAVYRGELYAAGQFQASGATPLRRLARWSEGAWHDVGGGLDRTVDVMAVFDDRLYLGGHFRLVGEDLPACRLAVWDGDDLLPVTGPPAAARVRLAQPAPNPFNPSTRVSFSLAREAWATLRVHDLRGRLVATLVDGTRPAGDHAVTWDGRDLAGRRVASGSYLLRLAAGGEVATAKVVLVE